MFLTSLLPNTLQWFPITFSIQPNVLPYPVLYLVFLGGSEVKESAYQWGKWVQSLGWQDPLEKGLATHSSILAWRVTWIEESGELQSMGSQRVGHDWATSLSLSDGKESACNAGDSGSIPESGRFAGEGIGNPLQYSCLENPMDRGAWQATVHGVSKSWTRLSDFHFHFQCV